MIVVLAFTVLGSKDFLLGDKSSGLVAFNVLKTQVCMK
jgi:hypothetical protein